MVLTAIEITTATTPDVLVIAEEEDCEVSLVRLLSRLKDLNIWVEMTTFAKARPKGRVCIGLSELSGSLPNGLFPH